MMRLILFLFLLSGTVLAFAGAMAMLRGLSDAPFQRGQTMPRPFQLIAFVLLILLMLGVSTGWLGAA